MRPIVFTEIKMNMVKIQGIDKTLFPTVFVCRYTKLMIENLRNVDQQQQPFYWTFKETENGPLSCAAR